jgi:hypothetical protein
MAIHDDNWTQEFKKVDAVEDISTLPLIWFITITACLYVTVPAIYNAVVSNPAESIRFSLVSSGIVIFAIAVKAALKLYVRNMK